MEQTKLLITSDEAIHLSGKTLSGELDVLFQIENKIKFMERNPEYFRLDLFSAIYTAGKIQGIRQERMKRKSKAACSDITKQAASCD